MPLSATSRRRVRLLAGKATTEQQVWEALRYAARLIPRSVGVSYMWRESDYHVDSPTGISYVERDDPSLPTVAYDWEKGDFEWQWRPQ